MMSAHGLTFQVETVTPARAAQWLDGNTNNRRVSSKTVERYAQVMRSGGWVVNGEAVKFDEAGGLLDGQHRLMAIVKADTSTELCIIRGLNARVFPTLDAGKVRRCGDSLQVAGFRRNPHAVAAAIRLLVCYQHPVWGRSQPGRGFRTLTADETLDVLAAHPDIDRVAADLTRKPLRTDRLPLSALTLLYYLASRVDPIAATRFFELFASDDQGGTGEERIPLALRDRIEAVNREYLKPDRHVKLAWAILAWNAYRRGSKTPPKFSRVIERMPRLAPDPFKPED